MNARYTKRLSVGIDGLSGCKLAVMAVCGDGGLHRGGIATSATITPPFVSLSMNLRAFTSSNSNRRLSLPPDDRGTEIGAFSDLAKHELDAGFAAAALRLATLFAARGGLTLARPAGRIA